MVLWQTEIKSSSLDSEFACPNEFVFNVDYGETKPFGYEMPQESHRLTVIVELDQKREEHVGLYCEPVDLEDM